MPIIIQPDAVNKDDIIIGDCTHPAGHCYGSDGGSGIPQNLKVPNGRGGMKEVWTLDSKKQKILQKDNYLICQYCLKYVYSETIEKDG